MEVNIEKVNNGYILQVYEDGVVSNTNVYEFKFVADERESELLAFKDLIEDLNHIISVGYDGFSRYNLEVKVDMIGDEVDTEDNI